MIGNTIMYWVYCMYCNGDESRALDTDKSILTHLNGWVLYIQYLSQYHSVVVLRRRGLQNCFTLQIFAFAFDWDCIGLWRFGDERLWLT